MKRAVLRGCSGGLLCAMCYTLLATRYLLWRASLSGTTIWYRYLVPLSASGRVAAAEASSELMYHKQGVSLLQRAQ
eukprot:356109-Rhodomonas_salina.1